MSNGNVTFINILEVAEGKQADVVRILEDATTTIISKRQGFISMAVLASNDGKRVVNIAKWASAADIEGLRADPAAAAFGEKLIGLATPIPGIYDVVGEFSA